MNRTRNYLKTNSPVILLTPHMLASRTCLALVFLLTAGMFFQSCAYRGAVFSQVNHIGVQAKSDPQTGIPIKVSASLDHAMIAITPQHNISSTKSQGRSQEKAQGTGEIAALIARTSMGAMYPLPQERAITDKVYKVRETKEQWRENMRDAMETALASTEDSGTIPSIVEGLQALRKERPTASYESFYPFMFEKGEVSLRARSCFLAGTPAIIASMPENTTIILQQNEGQKYKINLEETAEDRLGSAMVINSGFTPEMAKVDKLLYKVNDLEEEEQRKACKLIAACVSEEFKKEYEKASQELSEGYTGFHRAVHAYIRGGGEQSERHRLLSEGIELYFEAKEQQSKKRTKQLKR